MPWPAPPFALACPDSKAKCAALSEPSAADRCNEPETETAEVLSSMLLGCDARPCTYLDVGCNLGFVAGLAAAHGANAECFETYPLWLSAVRLHGLAQQLRLAPEGASQRGHLRQRSGRGSRLRCHLSRVRHRRTTCARQQLAQLKLDIDSKEGPPT